MTKKGVAHIKIGQPLEVEYRDLLDASAFTVDKVWAYGGAVKVDVTALVKISAILWRQIIETVQKEARQ
jgi:hypothetical protein